MAAEHGHYRPQGCPLRRLRHSGNRIPGGTAASSPVAVPCTATRPDSESEFHAHGKDQLGIRYSGFPITVLLALSLTGTGHSQPSLQSLPTACTADQMMEGLSLESALLGRPVNYAVYLPPDDDVAAMKGQQWNDVLGAPFGPEFKGTDRTQVHRGEFPPLGDRNPSRNSYSSTKFAHRDDWDILARGSLKRLER